MIQPSTPSSPFDDQRKALHREETVLKLPMPMMPRNTGSVVMSGFFAQARTARTRQVS
jgi:hypothetical protein